MRILVAMFLIALAGNLHAGVDIGRLDDEMLEHSSNFNACMDVFSVEHAGVNASPTEIAEAAAFECGGFLRRFFVRGLELVDETIGDGANVTLAQRELNARARKTLIDEYEEIATIQKDAAIKKAIATVIKERAK